MKNELLASKAYPLLIEEVEQLLLKVQSFIGHPVPDDSAFKKLAGDFHKLRGGAGLFGFEDMAETAAKLEFLLKTPGRIHEKIDQIKTLVGKLRQEAAGMPPVP